MGYLLLIGSALGYAVGILAQSVGAKRAEQRDRIDPGLLGRLAGQPVYLLGFAAQVVGFGLAFLARATLPLFLVQAGAMSAVGIAAVAGALLLGWRIRGIEIGALAVIAAGLLLLVGAAVPSAARELPVAAGWGLVGLLAVTALAAVPAARITGPRGGIALGLLAGVAFAVLAIASRPLASGPLLELPLQPLFWLMVVSALVGQALMAAAMQRGSGTVTTAAMDSVSVLLASVVGLVLLGDEIVAGRLGWVVGGLALVLCAVIVMAAVQPHGAGERPVAVEPTEVEREATSG
jgi:drug/metabolite transporter (DMT)-like permease